MTTDASLWCRNAAPYGQPEPLPAIARVQVAIVGGGVVGASAALHLAEAGIDTLMIDAGQIDGQACASLASGGLIAPQLIRGTPASLASTPEGERFVRMVAECGRYTFELIERLGLACDAAPNGFLAPFTARQHDASARVVDEWSAFRHDVTLLDADETARLTGCHGYAGAVLDSSGGGLNPLSFARDLAGAARARGATISHGNHVYAIEAHGAQRKLMTTMGPVVADRVILAANGGNMALAPVLRNTVLPMVVREVATSPLPPDLRARILPHGHAMTDRGPDIFTIRHDVDGRLVTAATMPWGRSHAGLASAVNARFARMIPGWRAQELEYAWAGTAWLNADLQPRYVQVDDATIAVQACNGRGVALAAPIGRDLAAWARKADHPLSLPLTQPRPIAMYPLARKAPNLALAMAAIKGRIGL